MALENTTLYSACEDSESQSISEEVLSDSIKMYLYQIQQFPLLEPEEEKELLQRIAQHDEDARKKLIESNLRLVVAVARKFSGRGVSFQDLIQAGNEGLIMATDRFDIKKAIDFLHTLLGGY